MTSKGILTTNDYYEKDGKYTLRVALVRVPQDFGVKKGGKLVLTRIPASGHVSLMAAKVAGYTPKGSSRVQISGMWIKRSDSDHDGDKMFTWKSGSGIDKQLHDKAFDMLTKDSV